MDAVTYAKSKRYTNETAQEFGGLKGANCEIQSITPITGGNRITFLWQNSSGATQSSTLDVMDGTDGQNGLDGQDGLSVASATINTSNNHLILTMSDSSTIDCGEVPTVQGEPGQPGTPGTDGFSPSIEVKTSTSELYILTIINKDGSFDTPNLKGGGGSGGASALSDLTDVALVGVSNGQILKYNATTHKWENSNGIEIDSISDIDDVEITNIQDNQILIYDATLGKWKNVYQLPQIQFSTMVEASTMPQAVVQYIGNDTADYKRGFFYRANPHIESGSIVYIWEQLNVQPSNSDYEQLTNHPEIGGVEIVGNKSLDDYGIQGKVQFTTLPTASENVGKIVQYTGANTSSLKKGYWYQSVFDSELSDYDWKQHDVSSNAALENKVTTLETNQGDMSALQVVGVNNLVAALNALNSRGLSTITYVEPNLILTYADSTVINFNVRDSILNQTQLGELANVTDSSIANTNVLQYDSAILGYKPYDIVAALTSLLQSAKDYTDQEIASSVQEDAFFVDAKPACSYDSSIGDYIVVYYQNGQVHTTTDTNARFYYKDSNDDPYCTSWFITGDSSVDPVEFSYLISSVDLETFVNKNTDIVSTYTPDMADKTKVPNVSALDALMALVNTSLSLKVNTSSIIDALTSQDATKVLSANQGYVIKGLIDEKNDKIQYATLPTAAATLSGVVYQYTGASSAAFGKGKFYTCLYDNENDTWYWNEIKYAADTDSALSDVSENPVQNKVIKAALDDKQDSTLSTPLVVEGITESTVETALSGLNTEKAKKFQLSTMPSPVADLENIVVQFIGNSTVNYNEGSFYKCKEITPATDPKTYEWGELTSQVELDDELSPTSTNGIENRAVTGALQALQAGVFLFYDSESVLPSTLDYAGGVIVALNSVAYCVLEQTFHHVSAIDSSTLAITWSPYTANIATLADISKHKNIWIGFREAWNNLSATERKTYDEAHFKGDDSGIDLRGYQKKQLDIPLPIGGATETTVEGAIGALDSEVDDEIATRSQLGAHNLLPFNLEYIMSLNPGGTWSGNEYVLNGVTFTLEFDESGLLQDVIADGTATAKVFFSITSWHDKAEYVGKILNGCTGGNGNTYAQITSYRDANNQYLADKFQTDGDYTVENLENSAYIKIIIYVNTGITVSNQKFYPMLRLATDIDATYQPYAKTNQELTAENEALTNQANDMVNVLGAKNLLPFPYYNTSKTQDGITWTVNSDGSISASGTATANSFFRITQDSDLSIYNNTILSGCPANGEMWSKWALYLSGNKDGQSVTKIDVGSGVLIEDIPAGYSGGLYAKVINGQTVNFTFKPMIRLASIQDDTYEPYSMTNKEMTPYVQAISNPNLLDNPWFTVNQRGLSTYSNVNYSYTVDRWLGSSGFDLYVDSDGVSVSLGNKSIFERFEDSLYNFLVGKTVTLSVLKSNGSIVSKSGVVKSNGNSFAYEGDSDVSLYLTKDSYANFVQVVFKNTTVKLRAVKLELGTVSTLAMDTTPNYQQELAKCQRYYQEFRSTNDNDWIALGFASTATAFEVVLPLIVPMRVKPTITMTDCNVTNASQQDVSLSKINLVQSDANNSKIHLNITPTTNLTNVLGSYALKILANSGKLALSADL